MIPATGPASGDRPPAVARSLPGALGWGLERALSVAYGVVYDHLFERFEPYQVLWHEIVARVVAAVPAGSARRSVHVLDVGCGPGNSTLWLAEAGFTVLGIDPYAVLVELAREKRRARRLPNAAFRHADLAAGGPGRSERWDQVVNVHSLYAHPRPDAVLEAAWRALRPGGHAVFVNFTRRVPLLRMLVDVGRRTGLGRALESLRWVLPNAVFEATRPPVGPHYWNEDEFHARVTAAGFTVLDMRRTFFDDVSLLVWARKDPSAKGW